MTDRTKWSLVLSVVPVLVVGALTSPLTGQTLADRVRAAPDGDVTFRFALKDGVELCDHGVAMRGSSSRVDLPRESVAEDAIAPAAMIDGVTIWPALLDLARDRSVSGDVREQAVFWLSQDAAEPATAGLASLAKDDGEDAEVRAAAVFALSQRPDEEGVPILMELAVTSRHAKVRDSSLFWLAQSKDPRVLPFFESILIGTVALR